MSSWPVRHSRSREFDAALSSGDASQPRGQWSDLAADPNAAIVLARRAETLQAAWRDPIPDRTDFIVDRCRGRRVLDIGCVAHDVERMSLPQWLHAQISAVAQSCLGVDVIPDGIAAMNTLGFDAIVHDLGAGLGSLGEAPPFDVIVAGELIEHVASMDMLFDTAKHLLSPTGALLLTTPNPYAPSRVHAGQRGIVWENVDHILYAFPSGIAELAERHGLVLAEAATTMPTQLSLSPSLKSLKQWVRGSRWMSVGYSTLHRDGVARVGSALTRATGWRSNPSRPFLGETFVYVVQRPSQ